MAKEIWVLQAEEKYRDHDLVIDDVAPSDMANIKGIAIRNFVETANADAASHTISAFMGYLTQKGFRITKVKND